MTKHTLDIELPDMGGSLSVPIELPVDPRMVAHQPFLEMMSLALSSDRGLKVNKPSEADAKAYRMRCYAARRYVQRQGIRSFDKLILTIEGTATVIRKELPIEVEFL